MSVIIYVIGLFFLAMGVAFSLNAQLGISPVNSLPYVVSNILGQDLGTCVVAVFSIYIVGQIVILRREFQWINLTQLIFSTLFGQFADLGKRILGDFTIPTYGGQLIMLAISIVFIALGVVFYIEASLVPMPMEGMTLAIAKKVNKPFPTVKIVVDCVSVSIGILLSLIFLGRVDPQNLTTLSTIWTVFARIQGMDTESGENWYQVGVDWYGEGSLSSSLNISREEMVFILYQALGFPYGIGNLSPFTDREEISDYAQSAMGWAVGQGIIEGRSATSLAPQELATRAELTTMLHRFLTLDATWGW